MKRCISKLGSAICALQIFGCSSAPNYPVSDHYNGSRFFNPDDQRKNTLWTFAKMMATTRRSKWPKFIEKAPSIYRKPKTIVDEVAVTFINHATVLIHINGITLLTDPVWSERVSPFTWAGPKRHRKPGIAIEDLPKIDCVVISHNHYDHMDIATLKCLNEKYQPRFVVPLGNKTFLNKCGLSNVTELDWWESIDALPDVKVSCTPAKHFSGRSPFDQNKTLWASYMISFGERSIYFGGDTAYSTHFRVIRERLGRPDLAFLPIGAYQPEWFMKLVHMNPEEAVQAHLDLGASHSVGIHFGTFQLTSERIDQPTEELETALKNRSTHADNFVALCEGRTRIFRLTNFDCKSSQPPDVQLRE